jgi:PAS domain S-box-containing protein
MPKILLVDAEPNARLPMQELLMKAGFEALTASDFNNAITIAQHHRLDAALVDMALPGKSGIEILKALRGRDSYIPVIMMTGERDISQIAEVVHEGAYDFVSKPVAGDALLSAVIRAVEHKRLADEESRLERQNEHYAHQLEMAVIERTRELADAHDFLYAVLDSSTEYAIIALDTEGRITLFNRGAELMLGYSAYEAMGEILSELVGIGVAPGEKIFLGWARQAETQGRHQEEVELRRADEVTFIASVTMTPIRAQSNPLGYLGVIKDLTIERQNEEHLRRMRERLTRREKLAALGRMAAQVAHEVKNPLAGLRLYALHLKSKIEGKIPASEETLVNKIIDGINQVSETSERVLNFARPITLTRRPADVNRIVADSIALVEPQLNAKKIKVELSLCESGVGSLDEASMRSMLINLMLNSIQAMSENGELSISTTNSGEDLRIEISDTGCGMSDEQIKHMFEPFYTTKTRGLGLGLYFAATVIELHGGAIHVESQADKGTRITITLPVEEGDADEGSGSNPGSR